ncbi:MAG: hypothetical protein GX935_01520 [Erysipelotrichia bacterium]|nr:hypothetical protein [Erysipelotrichia bacterium]
MKLFCWIVAGNPSHERLDEIIDAYVAGGCDGIEWNLPVIDPYYEVEHLYDLVKTTREKQPDLQDYFDYLEKARNKYPNLEIVPSIAQEIFDTYGENEVIEILKKNKIQDVFLVGKIREETAENVKKNGIRNSPVVTYKCSPEELEGVKKAERFVYLQTFPYEKDKKAGFTTDRFAEIYKAVKSLRDDVQLLCGQGIYTPEAVEFLVDYDIYACVPGSALGKRYDNLKSLTEFVKQLKSKCSK